MINVTLFPSIQTARALSSQLYSKRSHEGMMINVTLPLIQTAMQEHTSSHQT